MAWIKFLEVYLGKNAENFLTCKQYSNLDQTVIMEQSSMQVESCIIHTTIRMGLCSLVPDSVKSLQTAWYHIVSCIIACCLAGRE
jgi:hypothetical protein